MALQDRPICFDCAEVVEHTPVYESPCGHERCCSAVFHGVCLMRWREKREAVEKAMRRWLEKHSQFDDRRQQ